MALSAGRQVCCAHADAACASLLVPAMIPRDLATSWRSDAETFDRYGDAKLAGVCRMHADALTAALRDVDDEVLDLATAHEESGYSVERLRHMVADELIPNAGRKGAPRIRRGDLPKKTRAPSTLSFDAASAARDILASFPRKRAS